MTGHMQDQYDVVIMGGGPAGSTLAAFLRRDAGLSVAIMEREIFPREHIGESFAHPLVPVIQESGALEKVLESDCWIQKYGGVYNWGPGDPSAAYFEHAAVISDGVPRWSMHVNRAEFDHVLLNHAADCGADVFEGVEIATFEPAESGDDLCTVTFKDGRSVRARFFVDASGRQNNVAPLGERKRRDWLSGYKNIAIWSHFLDCEFTENLPGDWNIFRDRAWSPIGCFSFTDGWIWYIPTRQLVDGERKTVHSIGIVTNPAVLENKEKDYTDPTRFLETIRQVPLLKEMTQRARPVREHMLTATNYSRISERFASYEQGWLAVGDASYFVDPLFSSGASFAVTQAMGAALLLRSTFDPDLSEEVKHELWHDYDNEWRGMADTFALAIDQWYHAIGKYTPDSVYWNSKGSSPDLDIREKTFQALLNTALVPDLLRVMTHGSGEMEDLERDGPYMRAFGSAVADPAPDAVLTLAPNVAMRQTLGLDIPGFKGMELPQPYELPDEAKAAMAKYWEDPIANSHMAPAPLSEPVPCQRFHFTDGPDRMGVRALERDGGTGLWELLNEGSVRYGELCERLSPPQIQLVKRLVRAEMIHVS
ncbi:tryptophan 7-halogenase [Streptomyces sp. LX-29]|uniref:NAD(P)/FAD-dependent oxidoreductase n=1 Tax=Streptomyces sp. LX-29 TaxID=2900152 RepID=UPI00240E7670|nr:NAD(P)/FAD-dependent oxidoreductase [Streptomyces sp. LX-29]WFB10934.1 tryptophan 7-halogenase [Streptomyces sp. LX-29]